MLIEKNKSSLFLGLHVWSEGLGAVGSSVTAAAATAAAEGGTVAKSPSDFSCNCYELFVGQTKDRNIHNFKDG